MCCVDQLRPPLEAAIRNANGPARNVRAGRCVGGSVAIATVGTAPDEVEPLAVFLVEEVGIDRSGEARIVQFEAEIVAALIGLLRPGGTDFGATH